MPQTAFARILLIEDSDAYRAVLDRMLTRLDDRVEVVTAATLAEARNLLSRMRIDLILLDNSLPDGNGADFALELRDTARFAIVPVALISGWPSPFMYAKAKAAQVVAILSKDDCDLTALGDLVGAARILPPRPENRQPGLPVARPFRRRRTRVA